MVQQNKRPLVLSRYGGLGNHRGPIGFSGDTLRRWDTLDYEIYMTSRASNVLFGYWSHDIGGFSGGCVDTQVWEGVYNGQDQRAGPVRLRC